MKVFFFGAGASKACGLLLSTELLPALYEPESFGIQVERSQHREVVESFRHHRSLGLRFIEEVRADGALTSQLLGKTFRILALCTSQSRSYGSFSAGELHAVRSAISYCFSILLNPAYIENIDVDPYYRFVHWTKSQSDWITILTTNWDRMIDDLVDALYMLEPVDRGMVDLPIDILIPELMQHNNTFGRACSLYKFNGSVDWYFCPNDQEYYGVSFQPEFNLQLAQIKQIFRASSYLQREESPPSKFQVGNCPKCGTPFENAIYTPGTPRSAFPLRRRLLKNTCLAVELCRELTFIGFSCPEEDRELMSVIGAGLAKNKLLQSSKLRPLVVQIPGPHREELKARYEEILNTEIDYTEEGLVGWLDNLGC